MPAQVTYTAFAPKFKPNAGAISPGTRQVYPVENAVWKDGDILINTTNGTVTAPSGGTAASFTNATGALTPGPSLGSSPGPFNVSSTAALVQGVVTVTGVASSGAPARTLFCVVTYAITNATESQNSTPFIINLAAGYTATITVATAGRPAGATTFMVYLGVTPNTWARQLGAAGVTNTGSATANIPNPLTNSSGAGPAAAAQNTNILGVADVDSDAYYGGQQGATAGGSYFNGKRGLFGATQSYAPGWDNLGFAMPCTPLTGGTLEMTLVQPWNNTLLYAAVGINIDSATGYFVADTTQTQCGNIQDLAYSPGYGNVNDVGARVLVKFLGSVLI